MASHHCISRPLTSAENASVRANAVRCPACGQVIETDETTTVVVDKYVIDIQAPVGDIYTDEMQDVVDAALDDLVDRLAQSLALRSDSVGRLAVRRHYT